MSGVPQFIDYSAETPIRASFLNQVAIAVWTALGGTSQTPPTSLSDVLANLGLSESTGSASIGFQSQYPSTLPRVVQNKLRERISFDEFVGDAYLPTQDAAPAMVLALAAITASTNDIDLVFTKPAYLFNSPILPPGQRNFRFLGQGSQFSGTTFLIGHGAQGIFCPSTVAPTFDIENIVLKPAAGFTPTYGYQATGTEATATSSVYQTFRKVTAQGFSQRGIDIAEGFSCEFDCVETTRNGVVGLSLQGGSACYFKKPICEDNIGIGLLVGGIGHVIDCPTLENNCSANVGTGNSYRELLVTGYHIQVNGGVLTANASNPQYPIEITGNMVTISGMAPYSKGTAAAWVLLTGADANVVLLDSEMTLADGGDGGVANSIQLRPGVPGSFTSDILMGANSLAQAAVVSSGTNANGKWIQYANGWQVCQQGGFDQPTGTGPWVAPWTFPQPFVNTNVGIVINSQSDTASYKPNATGNVQAVTLTGATIQFSDVDIGYVLTAQGYWR